MAVDHKRVVRLMRIDNPLAVQLWVADITDIRLRGEFVYLALVLDVDKLPRNGFAGNFPPPEHNELELISL